ncbi:hypothetical protein [Levilactobacillus zymae]|uniref:hypothetical protein n=1 Tax=Levilactobacillus zymae TaxID=267363 RepID=UPI0028B7F9A1|nr:hypothetical protein [Levilactobacillus zymae]MDT6980923.1 hypothetical protein [Levilactobacillus zymae]
MLPFRKLDDQKSTERREGWLLADALIALSIVALTLLLTQQALLVTRRVELQRQLRLERARHRRDRRLEAWLDR